LKWLKCPEIKGFRDYMENAKNLIFGKIGNVFGILEVSAKYSCGFSNLLNPSIIVNEI